LIIRVRYLGCYPEESAQRRGFTNGGFSPFLPRLSDHQRLELTSQGWSSEESSLCTLELEIGFSQTAHEIRRKFQDIQWRQPVLPGLLLLVDLKFYDSSNRRPIRSVRAWRSEARSVPSIYLKVELWKRQSTEARTFERVQGFSLGDVDETGSCKRSTRKHILQLPLRELFFAHTDYRPGQYLSVDLSDLSDEIRGFLDSFA
jgi:hypothetical protein